MGFFWCKSFCINFCAFQLHILCMDTLFQYCCSTFQPHRHFCVLDMVQTGTQYIYQNSTPVAPVAYSRLRNKHRGTGKSLSEVLIYSSINPQYKNRLFHELRVQYEKITRSEHVENMSKTCYVHQQACYFGPKLHPGGGFFGP